jgi:kumamolisin
VTGTGGTRLDHSGGEVVWNEGGGATGGGISDKFPVPDFQKDVDLPANANGNGHTGRGAPDIAGDAAPSTGYEIRVGGQEQVVGGTSAVAPLYAGLMMRVNGALGHPVGYLNPILYKNANSGIFNDITDGNNNGYNAGPGWDAATGLGSIDGQKFLDLMRSQGV